MRVLAPDEAPILSGFLECESVVSFDENALLAPFRSRRAIAGEVTEIDVPPEVYELHLTASSLGLSPGSACLGRLRFLDGRRRVEGTIVEDVVIRLGRSLDGPALSGAVLVDGERRIPAGLSLELQDSAGEPVIGAVSMIDVANGEYSIGPLAAGELHVLASSAETGPAWLPVSRPAGNGVSRQDLELRTGVTLELDVRDSTTHRPVPGVELSVDTFVPTWEGDERRGFEGHERLVLVGGLGHVTIPGIPRPGTVVVRVARMASASSPPGDGAPEPLAVIEVGADAPDRLHESVLIGPGTGARAMVWGWAPDEGDFRGLHGEGALRVRAEVRANDRVRRLEATASPGGSWAFAVDVPCRVSAWVERGRRRVSRLESLQLDSAQATGPLGFAPVELLPVTLVSRGGKPGNRIEVLAIEAEVEERIDEFVSEALEDERTLLLAGECTLVLRSIERSRAVVQRALEVDPRLRSRVEVEWGGSRAVVLRAMLDGEPFRGGADVLLHLLGEDPATGCTFGLRMEEGCAPGVALEHGSYFFRIDGARDGALVCGVVEIDAASPEGELWLTWSGASVEVPSGARTVEVTRCGAADLTARVSPPFRRVLLGNSTAQRSAGPRSLRLPRGCSWSAFP